LSGVRTDGDSVCLKGQFRRQRLQGSGYLDRRVALRKDFRIGWFYLADLISGFVEKHTKQAASDDGLRCDFRAVTVGEVNGVGILVESRKPGFDQIRRRVSRRYCVDEEFGAVAKESSSTSRMRCFGMACAPYRVTSGARQDRGLGRAARGS
jgi:hypothetical protein